MTTLDKQWPTGLHYAMGLPEDTTPEEGDWLPFMAWGRYAQEGLWAPYGAAKDVVSQLHDELDNPWVSTVWIKDSWGGITKWVVTVEMEPTFEAVRVKS